MDIKLPEKLKNNRSLSKLYVIGLVSVALVTFLSAPRPAQAILPVPADIIGGPSQISSTIFDKIADAAEWAWQHGAAVAFKNAARTFTTRLAYDTAVMISSAGQGQKPLFSNFTIGQSIQRAADDAAGDFLDTLANQQTYVNLNICQPSSPTAQLVIGFTAFNEIQPRQPRCSLTTAIKNWETFVNDPNLLQNFGVVFDPRQNDLGIALQVQENLIRDRATASQVAALDLIRTAGWKDITEDITGFIKTPAGTVQDLQRSAIEAAGDDFSEFTGDIVADALGVFTNTLASRLLKRFLQEGAVSSPSRLYSTQFGFLGLGGIEYATQINSTISTPQLVGATGAVDVISDLANCPPDPAFYTPQYACTITPKFAQALRKADEGSPLTIQEAIDQGYIAGNLRFAIARTSDDLRAPTNAWYLSDIRKLRLARIVPLGWEIAAEKYAGGSVSLQDVIGSKSDNYANGFNATGPDKICGTEDDPEDIGQYCGLIDPNWILRAPPAQCRTEAYGQQLEPSGPNRQKVCVDYQHCIAEKADGSCQAWGYCKREENIWRFSGKSCEFPEGSGVSPWATCQSFKDPSGKNASYLISSLNNYDDGVCSDAASCRWYSAARNLTPEGVDDVYLPNKDTLGTQNNINTVDFELSDQTAQPRFFLKNVDNRKCTTKEEGCTKFLQLSNINTATLEELNVIPVGASYAEQVEAVVDLVTDGAIYSSYDQLAASSQTTLRQAPQYLNCYDVNPNNRAPECANYLQLCAKNDVGCELYTPRDGSPAVPGIVTQDNICPGECNGFNTYQQTSSFFENYLNRDPVEAEPTYNFIPTTAKICSATHVGCEEFTNIEQNERKEYYSELRQCVRPEDELDNTYYTWVGSDLTGYQLKTWQLQAIEFNPGCQPTECYPVINPLGPPITTDGSGDCMTGNTSPSPDCKEFYVTNGPQVAVHYRLESKVVYSSASCNRYRATSVVVDDCERSGGTWESDNRCYYRAIPNQGKVCPAAANGCREYRGPTAGNVRYVFPVSTFGDVEPGVNADSSPLSGWEGGTNSTESSSAFGHSLKLYTPTTAASSTHDLTGLLTTGKQYMLSFWVKPDGAGGSIFAGILAGSSAVLFTPLTGYPINNEWQIVNLGPVEFTGDDKVAIKLIIGTGILGSTVYFDNISFREIQDTFYVRKNSWVTPASCVDDFLRCSAYNTRDRQTVYLTGFSKLCQAEVVGCRALIDTHNSSTPPELTITAGDQEVVVPEDNVVYRVYDSKKSCSSQFAGCKRLGLPNFLPSGEISSWSDIYTVLNPDTFDPGINQGASPLCSSEQNMCQVFTDNAGVPHYFKEPGSKVCEYKIIDSTVGYEWYKQGTNQRCNLVANPSFEIYTPGDGDIDIFTGWSQINTPNYLTAEPSFNGLQYWGGNVLRLPPLADGVRTQSPGLALASPSNKTLASYVRVRIPSAVTQGTITLTTRCTLFSIPPNPPTTIPCPMWGGDMQIVIDEDTPRDQWLMLWQLVRTPPVIISRVGLQITASGTDGDIYLDQVQSVELLSSLNINQAREVAREPYAYNCPSNQAGCTAYSDPELTKKTYYYLNDKDLNKGLCNGQVSEKEGCLLFSELSNSNLTYNALATYENSRSNNNKLVAPSSTNPKNTNLVLKVRRDRACAEWLSCQSESPRYNRQTGRYDNVCYSLGVCNQLGANSDGSGRCDTWVTSPIPAQTLSLVQYQKRGTNWSSLDYSGYSLPNIYPIEVLTQKEYGTAEESNVRLTYLNQAQKTCGGVLFNGNNTCTTLGCGCPSLDIGDICSGSITCQFEDLGLTGEGPGPDWQNTGPKLCRAFPQTDAPFPVNVVMSYKPACTDPGCPGAADATYVELPETKDTVFKDANVCQSGEICECSYKRLTYQDGNNLFYSLMSEDIPAMYTTEVSEDFNGNKTQLVNRLKQQNLNIGLKGYCLEKDPSRPINAGADNACLTWLPIDSINGEISVYDYSPEAGYQGGSTLYCSNALGKNLATYVVNASQYGVQHREGNPCGKTGVNGNFVIGGCSKNPWDVNNSGGRQCYWNGSWSSCPSRFSLDASGHIVSDPTYGDGYIMNDNSVEGAAGVRLLIPNEANESLIKMYQIAAIKVTALPSSKSWDWYDFTLTPENLVNPSSRNEPPYNDYIVWRYSNSKVGQQNVIYFDVLFDKNDQSIRGYALVTDDYTGEGNEGVGYNIKFYIKEICTETLQTATAIKNKAWTDRILRRTDYQVEPYDDEPPPVDPTGLGFTSSRIPSPYGKTSLVTAPQDNQLLVVSDVTSVTTPFACSPSNCGGNNPGTCISDNKKFGNNCTESSQCTSDGVQGVCTGYFSKNANNKYRTLSWANSSQGINRIQQLFSAVYQASNFDGIWTTTGPVDWLTSGDISCGEVDCDSGDTGTEGGLLAGNENTQVPTPPLVRQVIFDVNNNVLPGNAGMNDTEGMTIQTNAGSWQEGDITIESSDVVTVAFYAFNPNGEQMPLRKVFVDWGDGSSFSGAYSSYKNHKAVCKTPNDPDYNWGDNPNACVGNSGNFNGYFTYSHVYTCAQAGGCDYKPRIFVEDNWEWCAKDGWRCNSDSNPRNPPAINGDGWIEYANTITVNQAPAGGGGGTGNIIVSPSGASNSCGQQGGPFSPSSVTYYVVNDSPNTINWTATAIPNIYASLSKTSGTLGPGSSTSVIVTFKNFVNFLPPGLWPFIIQFDNTTNGIGPDIIRILTLRIVATGENCGEV